MTHPKKKLLPKKIETKPDATVAEKLFGKGAKRDLDRIVDASRKSIQGV